VLQPFVQDLKLRWDYNKFDYDPECGYEYYPRFEVDCESGTEDPIVLSKWCKKDKGWHKIHPPADEIRQIQEYAINNGLEGEKEAIRQIGISGDAGLQVRAIVLLLSLPCLQALHFTHDHKVRHFDTLFLKLVLAQQLQKLRFLPNLTSFERKCSENSMIGTFSISPFASISHMVPIMLIPSIQTVSATYALMPKGPTKTLNLRDLLTNKSLARVSSVYTLNLSSCRISNEDLELVLQFPRDLRSLSITLWMECQGNPRPHFKSTLDAIQRHAAHSLEHLHLCPSASWNMDRYSPNGIFCKFARLEHLSLHIKQLLGHGSRNMGDINKLLPPTLTFLAIFLESDLTKSELEQIVKLIDEIVTKKGRKKIGIVNVASELSFWRYLGKEQL
jgi:hypothetical protein